MGQQVHGFMAGLGNEHPVERVLVVQWQRSQCQQMVGLDRQLLEIVFRQLLDNVLKIGVNFPAIALI